MVIRSLRVGEGWNNTRNAGWGCRFRENVQEREDLMEKGAFE